MMETISGIKCSRAHMSKQDNEIFADHAHRDRPWIHDTCYGYLLMFREYRHPGLMLKSLGISKPVRKLIYTMIKYHEVEMINFDRDADPIEGFEVFDW